MHYRQREVGCPAGRVAPTGIDYLFKNFIARGRFRSLADFIRRKTVRWMRFNAKRSAINCLFC